MARSDSIAKLSDALSKAQGEMRPAKRASKNERLGSDYADLAAVWEACRGPLTRNGLAVVQLPASGLDAVAVETVLSHSSGEWISCSPMASVQDRGPQAMATAVTYLKRIGLMAIAGVVAEGEDDDAESVTPPSARAMIADVARAVISAHQGPEPLAPKRKYTRREKPVAAEAARAVVSTPPGAALPAEVVSTPPNPQAEKAAAKSLVALQAEAASRARATRLWERAMKLGWSIEEFRHFGKTASGSDAPSNQWTETDLTRIEAAMAKAEGEDVPF